jgi:hypothetical protein
MKTPFGLTVQDAMSDNRSAEKKSSQALFVLSVGLLSVIATSRTDMQSKSLFLSDPL